MTAQPDEIDKILDIIQAVKFINEDNGSEQLATIGHEDARQAITTMIRAGIKEELEQYKKHLLDNDFSIDFDYVESRIRKLSKPIDGGTE